MRRASLLLLAGLPVALVSQLRGGHDALTFSAAAVSLVPLALGIGAATDQLAVRLGASFGGLLNATFSNAAELIIAVLALRRGLVDLVKASITGSIIGNTLLNLGLSAFVGGVRHGPQKFAVKPVGRNAAMMILAVSAMGLPAVFAGMEKSEFVREELSIGVAVILLATYGAYLFYSYFSPRARGRARERREPPPSEQAWSVRRALVILAASVVGTAISAELLVHTVEPVSKRIGLTTAFVGLILVPLIGNLAEYVAAADFAIDNRVELSIAIAANSSTQVAVFVAPLLVILSLLFSPMNLIFRSIELATLFASSAIFAYISLDGETNWLEGVQLLALYLVAAVAFFFLH